VCFMIGCWWLVSQLPWAQASMRSAPSECWSKALRNLHQTSPGLVAGLRLLLLSYSNLVATSFSLLTCRTLAGSDQRVIFRQGTSSCPMTWQLAPLLLAILMTLIPLALVSWVRRNREQHPNAVASLCSVFAPGHQHWFAVLLYQRWLMTLIYAFIFSPLWRGLLQALLCAANLLLGVGQRPFRGQKAQALYTTSLALLLIIAVLALPSQIKASLASTESLGNHVDNRRALAGLQFVAALLPGCLVAVWFAATKFWPRLRHWSRKPQVRLENHFENELMDDPSPWVTA